MITAFLATAMKTGAAGADGPRRNIFAPALLFACLALCQAPTAWALNFDPTDMEWVTWPGYCKARSHEETDLRVRPEDRARWKASFTVDAWKPLHHYCAGIVKVVRAARLADEERRNYFTKDAIAEYDYWLDRVPQDDPFYPTVLAAKADALVKLGQPQAAEKLLKTAVSRTPNNTRPYLQLALMYERQKRLEDARDILTRANEVAKEKSAEVWYFLGLVNFKMKDYEAAEKSAKAAYALGYPLPGLKRKLKAQGYLKN